jgi:cephalosporin-C deacetylase
MRAAKCILILVALTFTPLCQSQEISIAANRTNGVYEVGDTVQWRVEWQGGTNAPKAQYKLKEGGLTEIGRGELNFSNNVATLQTRFEKPGTLLVRIDAKSDSGKDLKAAGGAVAAPNRISLSAQRPADFEAFWSAKLAELETIPPNPKLEKIEIGHTNITYWKITMDNIRGSHIQGQLSRPIEEKKYPALLIVQWAGVYALESNWVTDRSKEGWLVLNIEAHDLPIDQPRSFYKEQSDGPLKNYWAIGNEDRDKSYFLRMYLSCYRAAEYLTQRPDWNGKTLVVMGGSQGGQQALMTAGFHPKITAALASVPAGCDMLGPVAGRSPGWPQWYFKTDPGKDPEKVRETSRYYDVANFTPRIKCPVLIGVGLIDEVCPPAGIFAAANQIESPKEVIILPAGAHHDERDSHGAYNRQCYNIWLPALREGKSPLH